MLYDPCADGNGARIISGPRGPEITFFPSLLQCTVKKGMRERRAIGITPDDRQDPLRGACNVLPKFPRGLKRIFFRTKRKIF